jgi:hypothetical protein
VRDLFDMVWRLRLKDRWPWVSLVLEFQSEPDPWMALRLLVYLGLLCCPIQGKKRFVAPQGGNF